MNFEELFKNVRTAYEQNKTKNQEPDDDDDDGRIGFDKSSRPSKRSPAGRDLSH